MTLDAIGRPNPLDLPKTKVDQKRIAITAVCVLAALAPSIPDVVLTRGIWISGVIVLLRWRKARTPDFLAIGLATFATLSTLGSLEIPAARLCVLNYWCVCLLFIATRCTVKTRRDFTLVGMAYLSGCMFAAVQISVKALSAQPSTTSFDGRIGIDGVNFNYTAYALATGVVVAAGLLRVGDHKRWIRNAILLTFPAFAYAVVQTDTRGAQVSMTVSLMYLLVAKVSPRIAWRSVLGLVPALLVTVPLGIYGDTRLLWLQDYFGRATTNLAGRTDLWPVARQMWSDHLFAGIGAGMFPVFNSMHIGAHSLVLSVGTELGLLGLAAFAATVVSAWVLPSRDPHRGRVLIGLLAMATLPIWLSGMWEVSPAGWMAIALWSRLPEAAESRPDG